MENEQTKKTFETTEVMRQCESYLSVLQEGLKEIMQAQPWWRRSIPVSEKLEYLRELARAKASLWGEVYKAYPDAKGLSLSFGQKVIREV